MKKILCYLMLGCLIGLGGCTTKGIPADSPAVESEVKPAVSAVDLGSMFNKDAIRFFSDNYGGLSQVSSQLSLIGTEFITDLELTTYDGKTINMSEYTEQNVIIEMVADWCSYCQEQSKTHLDTIVNENPTVKVLQVFVEGTKEQIKEFYAGIDKDVPTNITIIPQSEGGDELATLLNLQSFPTIVFKDDANKIGWVHSGLLPADQAPGIIDVTFGENRLYNMLNDGATVEDYTRNYLSVKNDLSTEAIDLITKVNSNVEAEGTIYGNLAKRIIPTDFIDINNEGHSKSELQNKEVVYSFIFSTDEIEGNKAFIESYEAIKAKYASTTFVTVVLPYSENDTVQEFVKGIEHPLGDIVIDASGDKMPEFLNIVDLYYVPTLLFQNKDNLIAGALVGDYSQDIMTKAYSTFMADTPIYNMHK